jgi:hypothetical protein
MQGSRLLSLFVNYMREFGKTQTRTFNRYNMVGFPNSPPGHLLSTRDRPGQAGKSRNERKA